MKKLIVIIAGTALGVWGLYELASRGLSWVWAKDEVATTAARPWPGGLGTIDSVAARYPTRKSNEAALKVTSLANALPKNDLVENFVGSEIARGELTIGQPPALPDVSAIRDILLRNEIVWARPGGIGEIGDQETSARRAVQMTVARALVASALAKAHTQDPAAWEDLRAVWNLAKSMDRQPQVMEQTAVLSMVRMINAVAWKMPLPVPAWFGELQQRDSIQRLLEAFQYQVASYSNGGSPMIPTRWHASTVEHDQRIAEKVYNETRCDATIEMNDLGTDLSSVWRRAFRYRAEREATANALRVREGKPIEAKSRCRDGAWTWDGTTLRFDREIATTPPDRPMPLVLQVRK